MRHSFLFVACLSLASACATTTPLSTTSLSQAAKAEVKLKVGPNGNAVGNLVAEYLAPPALAAANQSVYSVWIRQNDGIAWTNMGQMQVGESRRGEFLIQTPHEAFDILVTAEAKPTAVSPSEFVVLRGRAAL